MANIPMDDETRKKLFKEMFDQLVIPSSTGRASGSFSWDIHHYTEPCQVETDEEGNIYGYKVLIWDTYTMQFHSLVYPVYWSTQLGELTADRPPCGENRNGIYFMKQMNDPEIDDYFRSAKHRTHRKREFVFIVRCVLVGRIVEAERGFRSEHARIEGVYSNGYWTTYQDFRAEAEAYYRRRYEEPAYQDWEAITRYDYLPNPVPRMARTDEDSTTD